MVRMRVLRWTSAALVLISPACFRSGYERLDPTEATDAAGGVSGSPVGAAGTSLGGSAGVGGRNPLVIGGTTNSGGSISRAGSSSITGAGGAGVTGGANSSGLGGVTAGGGGASSVSGSTARGGGIATGGGSETVGGAAATGGSTSASAGGGNLTNGGTSAASGGTTATSTGGLSGGGTSGGGTSGGGTSGGGTSGGGTSAGASSGGGTSAGGMIGGDCDWSAAPPQFGTAQSLGAPNTALSEIDPVVSRDGLRLYFVAYTDKKSGNDIYIATRNSTSAAFGAGIILAAAKSTANETHFIEAASGLESFLSSNRSGSLGGVDIFHATRGSTTDPWSSFSSLVGINTTGDEFDPHLESDGFTLWFDPIGRTNGAGMQDIFYARRPDAASDFGASLPASVLNSPANDWNVSLTDDGLVIVFQSDRGTSPHVYYAIRSARGASFGTPEVLTALDPYMATLGDPFVSPEGCAVYFAAQLSGGAGLSDLYVVRAN